MKRIKIIGDTAIFDNSVYIHPLLYMLKTYHDNFGKSKNEYIWLEYKQRIKKNEKVKTIIHEIISEKVDILCFSVYVWNSVFLFELAKEIKKINHNIIIIMGGPDLTTRTSLNWFKENPYVDYVIYGDGEKAFSLLLDYFQGYEKNIDNIPNLIYQKNGKQIINKFEILKSKEYFAISPWQHCSELFAKDVVKYLTEIKEKNINILWERTRGCPYSCSFCDWSGGLHNKITRKTYDFKKDIDLFDNICKKYDISLFFYMIDANIGIFDEDIEIFKYICENKQNIIVNFGMLNWAKNHKERVYKIWDLFYETLDYFNNNFKIAQQDINDFVLNNIDRPSIPWNNIKEYIISNKKIADTKISKTVELIAGLPGQTKDSWYNNLIECASIGADVFCHPWILLPYAPSSDPKYQQKFKIKFKKTFIPIVKIKSKIDDRLKILNNFIKEENNILFTDKNKLIYSTNMVTETYSYNLQDLLFFHLSMSFYNYLISGVDKNDLNFFKNYVEDTLMKKKHQLEKLSLKYYEIWKNDLDKYDCILFSFYKKGYYVERFDWFDGFEDDYNMQKERFLNDRPTEQCSSIS